MENNVMRLYKNELYLEDILYVASLDLPWDKLKNKKILISGATGLIGLFLIDVLMMKNEKGLNLNIYAMSRNKSRAEKCFLHWKSSPHIHILSHDISVPFASEELGRIDYILHLASNTHPVLYSQDPIGTITTNVFGAYNMLELAVKHSTKRFAFVSSNEVYGENRGDIELFDENYCGYINCNSLRAGYPESKRCGEALCQAYKSQRNIDYGIPRITRTYGPTMSMDDTKVISQFIKNAIYGNNIVLKSEGQQYFSFTYVADAVSGLLYVLLKGKNGEAYNISDISSDITLRDLAECVAKLVGKSVEFDFPSKIESAGYSKSTKARLDSSKLKSLGWKLKYDIQSGLSRTIAMLGG